ncbi:MAG: N-acetylmuramoyl-L-alanine amidase CwlD, partial [Bacilli bacterium]
SNEEEQKRLGSERYQEKIAAAIYRGILRYVVDAEKETS